MSERERGNDSPTDEENAENREGYDDPADDPERAPTEPRDTAEGQQQAAEAEEGEIDEGAEPDERDSHPDADADDGADDGAATHGTTEPVGQRETAPQSDFTTRQVGIGVAVLAVGLIVAFALPLLLV